MAEIIVRFEQPDGSYKAYAVDIVRAATSSSAMTPEMLKMCPGFMKPLVDAFIFGLRHGVIQKMCKEQGRPAPDLKGPDKDIVTVRELVLGFLGTIYKSTVHPETGAVFPVDIRQGDLKIAQDGLVRRAPEFDGVPNEYPEPQVSERGIRALEAESTATV